MGKMIYTAIFLDAQSIEKIENLFNLKVNVADCHTTLAFRPTKEMELPFSLVGQKIDFMVDAIGSYMDQNIGLKVDISTLPKDVLALSANADCQHITIRVENGGKPMNTRFCEWDGIEPISLSGTLGYLDGERGIIK